VDDLDYRVELGGVRISVHVKPRASKSRVLGVRGRALDVAIAAPPVDGEANAELRSTLARYLKVAPSAVRIVSGAGSRHKLVFVDGLDESALLSRVRG
jgi:hypothetical protein